MKILQTLTFRSPRDATDGVLFDSVLQALRATGYDASNIRFWLDDPPGSLRRTSAVSRVLNAFPDLEKFRGSYEKSWENTRTVMLSNAGPGLNLHSAKPLTRTVTSEDPIAPEVLSEILHGVPRRFPFFSVNVLFVGAEALNAAQSPAEEVGSSNVFQLPRVELESRWSSSKRRPELSAAVAVAVPAGDDVPPLPAPTQALVDALGKVVYTGISVTPAATDQERITELNGQARLLAERYAANPFVGRTAAVLPRALPVVERSRMFGVPLIERKEAGIPSIKELLKEHLGPLGYRYKSSHSGQGCYTLLKHGAQNYVLEFFADASPMAGQLCSSFRVETAFARFVVNLQLPPHGGDYPINEHVPDVLANMAFVVQVLEETFVRELEGMFGPAPKWYAVWRLRN